MVKSARTTGKRKFQAQKQIDFSALEELARRIRVHTLRMTQSGRSSHVGTSFSMAELLAVLYKVILRVVPATVNDPDRDRFILSKGHGCTGLYAVMAECGFFPLELLETFYKNGGRLAGHVTTNGVPGIELSTGSLGHGLGVACGMAKAGCLDERAFRVFALLSDGECDEGSTWEAVLFSAQHHLSNLVAIIDYNRIQSMDRVSRVLKLAPLADKWRAFGWATKEIDGHDVKQIHAELNQVPFEADKPSCLIAHTIKGKGVSFMEDTVLWHYRSPQGEEYTQAMAELGESV